MIRSQNLSTRRTFSALSRGAIALTQNNYNPVKNHKLVAQKVHHVLQFSRDTRGIGTDKFDGLQRTSSTQADKSPMTLLLDRPTQHALVDLKRVLIIDDEEPIRRLLGYMLQSHGYETVLASDAKEARVRLAEASFALVLCDVNMPGESGMDLVRSILSQHPHTAAIMVTGLDSPVLANAALDMGAFGYIIKPFESNEVLINVANALRRRRLEM
jgi:CheY-like chemotaxis protein